MEPAEGGGSDLLDHVRAKQDFYIGCVIATIKQWALQGRQRTNTTGHDMRDWAQVMDWIVTNVW